MARAWMHGLERFLDETDFPFALSECAGEGVLESLEKERRRGRLEGFTPVLVGTSSDVEMFTGVLDARIDTAEEVLDAARDIVVEDWLEQREAMLSAGGPTPVGAWPEATPPPASLRSHRDVMTREVEDRVYVARIPTRSAWEVPAYLGLGGFGVIPAPELQVAISERWHTAFDAEIVAVTVDLIEYAVVKPPKDRAAAESLAREHFLYAPDIASESEGGLLHLAARLVDAGYWHFWWQ